MKESLVKMHSRKVYFKGANILGCIPVSVLAYSLS